MALFQHNAHYRGLRFPKKDKPDKQSPDKDEAVENSADRLPNKKMSAQKVSDKTGVIESSYGFPSKEKTLFNQTTKQKPEKIEDFIRSF